MRLLLDTHIVVWWALGDPRLSQRGRGLIGDDTNDIWVSVATIWEVAIKNALRRGDGMGISGKDVAGLLAEAGFAVMPVQPAHVTAVETMPRLHGDPFDRMLIAQAQVETMRLVTHDGELAAYGEHVLIV